MLQLAQNRLRHSVHVLWVRARPAAVFKLEVEQQTVKEISLLLGKGQEKIHILNAGDQQ